MPSTLQMCKLCSRMACCAKMPALPAHRSPVLLAGERCHGPSSPLGAAGRRPPPGSPAPRPFPRPTKMQGTRRPAHVFPRGARAGPRSTATLPAGSTAGAPSPPRRPHGARPRSGARRAAPATRAGARCCASAPFSCSCRPARGPATDAAISAKSSSVQVAGFRFFPHVNVRHDAATGKDVCTVDVVGNTPVRRVVKQGSYGSRARRRSPLLRAAPRPLPG